MYRTAAVGEIVVARSAANGAISCRKVCKSTFFLQRVTLCEGPHLASRKVEGTLIVFRLFGGVRFEVVSDFIASKKHLCKEKHPAVA